MRKQTERQLQALMREWGSVIDDGGEGYFVIDSIDVPAFVQEAYALCAEGKLARLERAVCGDLPPHSKARILEQWAYWVERDLGYASELVVWLRQVAQALRNKGGQDAS